MSLFGDGRYEALGQIVETYSRATINHTLSPLETGAEKWISSEGYGRYCRDGQRGLELILSATIAAGQPAPKYILDMPCGYGRVARHIRAAFPSAHLTVCDIEPPMLEFCSVEYDAEPVMSSLDFSAVRFAASYDIIFCGSLLTHLPEKQFGEVIGLFSRYLRPGGVAIVTTHGRYVANSIRGIFIEANRLKPAEDAFNKIGFGYCDYVDDESDPRTGNYGISLSTITYVASLIAKDNSLRLLSCTERAWNNQDVIAFQKL